MDPEYNIERATTFLEDVIAAHANKTNKLTKPIHAIKVSTILCQVEDTNEITNAHFHLPLM
jgi:hypothetical protein